MWLAIGGGGVWVAAVLRAVERTGVGVSTVPGMEKTATGTTNMFLATLAVAVLLAAVAKKAAEWMGVGVATAAFTRVGVAKTATATLAVVVLLVSETETKAAEMIEVGVGTGAQKTATMASTVTSVVYTLAVTAVRKKSVAEAKTATLVATVLMAATLLGQASGQKREEVVNWCYKGWMKPCAKPPEIGHSDAPARACTRSVISRDSQAMQGHSHLHACGVSVTKGCGDDHASSVFDTAVIFNQAMGFLFANPNIYYLCRPPEKQFKKYLYDELKGKSLPIRYTTTTCICDNVLNAACNHEPLTKFNSFEWSPDLYTNPAKAKYEELSNIKSFHRREEYHLDQFKNNTAWQSPPCPMKVSLELLDCANKKDADAEYFLVYYEYQILAHLSKSGGSGTRVTCLNPPWCWILEGNITITLFDLKYHLHLKFTGCSQFIEWVASVEETFTFLPRTEVKPQVLLPCNELKKPGDSKTLPLNYTKDGIPFVTPHLDNASFYPTDSLSFRCYIPSQSLPEPAETANLGELKDVVWIALAVWLIQVGIAVLLLPFALVALKHTREVVDGYDGSARIHLVPFLRHFSVPDNLVETFLELHFLDEAAEDFKQSRDMISDHQRGSTYNFFGWRTDLDCRLFPCFGEPPPAEEHAKCDCPECKHIPRINLTRLIPPARLIAMGLKDRALVDRKDPLYDTYLALHTDDCLPRDAKSKGSGTGDANASGGAHSVSPKVVPAELPATRRPSDDVTQASDIPRPQEPSSAKEFSDQSTVPVPSATEYANAGLESQG